MSHCQHRFPLMLPQLVDHLLRPKCLPGIHCAGLSNWSHGRTYLWTSRWQTKTHSQLSYLLTRNNLTFQQHKKSRRPLPDCNGHNFRIGNFHECPNVVLSKSHRLGLFNSFYRSHCDSWTAVFLWVLPGRDSLSHQPSTW